MTTSLCIQVTSEAKSNTQTINFLQSESWTSDSEKELFAKMEDLLAVARRFGKTFAVRIDIEAANVEEVIFQIKKRINKVVEINNQKLSIREIEVLGLIMQGLTNHDIAEKLFISYETVRSHRKNILEKTGAKNTAALIHHYHQTFFEK
jgi:DNA-binding CsgD family transcriptional regulator